MKESGGEIHGMDAGHWFMKKYSKFITDLIIRRITKRGWFMIKHLFIHLLMKFMQSLKFYILLDCK